LTPGGAGANRIEKEGLTVIGTLTLKMELSLPVDVEYGADPGDARLIELVAVRVGSIDILPALDVDTQAAIRDSCTEAVEELRYDEAAAREEERNWYR